MTRRRFHRTTEAIPRRPWKSKSPFASRPMKINTKEGTRGVRARYDAALPPFISVVRAPDRPVMSVPDTGFSRALECHPPPLGPQTAESSKSIPRVFPWCHTSVQDALGCFLDNPEQRHKARWGHRGPKGVGRLMYADGKESRLFSSNLCPFLRVLKLSVNRCGSVGGAGRGFANKTLCNSDQKIGRQMEKRRPSSGGPRCPKRTYTSMIEMMEKPQGRRTNAPSLPRGGRQHQQRCLPSGSG